MTMHFLFNPFAREETRFCAANSVECVAYAVCAHVCDAVSADRDREIRDHGGLSAGGRGSCKITGRLPDSAPEEIN